MSFNSFYIQRFKKSINSVGDRLVGWYKVIFTAVMFTASYLDGFLTFSTQG